MRRDVIANVFLFFTAFSLLLIFRYPVYFSYGQIFFRAVSIPERIFSVIFILLWLALCVYAAYFKRIYLLIGGILYGLLPYLPGLFIPMLTAKQPVAKPDLITTFTISILKRIYEIINAPFVGVSVLFPPGKAVGLGKLLLPVLLFTYIGTHLFRFYRNAYLAEKLRLDDTSFTAPKPAPKTVSPVETDTEEKLQDSVRPASELLTVSPPEDEPVSDGEPLPDPPADEPILLPPPQVPDEPIRLSSPKVTDEPIPPETPVEIVFEKTDPVMSSDSGEENDPDHTLVHLPLNQPIKKKRSVKPRQEEEEAPRDL